MRETRISHAGGSADVDNRMLPLEHVNKVDDFDSYRYVHS